MCSYFLFYNDVGHLCVCSYVKSSSMIKFYGNAGSEADGVLIEIWGLHEPGHLLSIVGLFMKETIIWYQKKLLVII